MKMSTIRNFVIVFPDLTEYYTAVEFDRLPPSMQEICNTSVAATQLRTSRSNPAKIKVELFELKIDSGILKRWSLGKFDVMPRLLPMTSEEYDEKMSDILTGVPEEFKSYVSAEAYDRSHSAGYEETINTAVDIVSRLSPCINLFIKRIVP